MESYSYTVMYKLKFIYLKILNEVMPAGHNFPLRTLDYLKPS